MKPTRNDQVNYSHFLVRRLMSEQIVDSMVEITGIPEKFPSMPLGKRAMSDSRASVLASRTT